jgi:2-iminobutanoate/2-iminopropanoate deaminase
VSLRIIQTDQAPAAIGPYNQGVITGNLIFTSMQIPLDPASGEIVGTTAAEQVHQCLSNVEAILKAGGCSLQQVVKTTLFFTDLSAFGEVNQVYGEFFAETLPARGVLQVAALPKGALVAVEAVAGLD